MQISLTGNHRAFNHIDGAYMMQARKLINKQCNKKLGPSSGRNLEVDRVWGAFIQIGPSCGKKCKFLSIYVLKLDQFVKKNPAN